MTNTDQTSGVSNDILERASRVRVLLRKSASVWLEIAKEVYEAKQILSANDYCLFLDKASLTAAIADKMPTIAKSSELYSDKVKRHIHKFEGWSTLYEAAKLKADERTALLKSLDTNPEADVSRAFIQSFKKSTNSKSVSVIIAQLKVNESDLSRLDYDQFQDLKQQIDDFSRVIDRLSPAVSFSQSDQKITEIENIIIDSDHSSSNDLSEHIDDMLPVIMPAANTDCRFSEVAI